MVETGQVHYLNDGPEKIQHFIGNTVHVKISITKQSWITQLWDAQQLREAMEKYVYFVI